jgi:hypothetical protein
MNNGIKGLLLLVRHAIYSINVMQMWHMLSYRKGKHMILFLLSFQSCLLIFSTVILEIVYNGVAGVCWLRYGTLEAITRKQHFIVPVQTQWTHLQRLSPENKRVSPYVPLQAGYRSKKQGLIHMVIFNFIDYFTLVLCDFPLPGATWPSPCSDFSCFISRLCHPYLPATFSGLRSILFSFDPPPC